MADREDGMTTDGEPEGRDGITRKDFLDGAAITAAGLAAAAASPYMTGAEAALVDRVKPLPKGYYPPKFDSERIGHPDNVVRKTMKIDGKPITDPGDVSSTRGRPRDQPTGEEHGRGLRLRDRGRGRQRARVGQVLPRPLRGGLEDPLDRRAARLRRALQAKRIPHPQRRRGRAHDDPAQRRRREHGQHRHLERGRREPDGHPGRVRTARARPPRLSRGRRERRQQVGGGRRHRHPEQLRPAPDAAVPVRGLRNRPLHPGSQPGSLQRARAEHARAGWQHFLDRTPYSDASKQSILDCQTTDQDWLANAPGRAADAGAEDRLPLPDHVQALPDAARRRHRGGVPRGVLARQREPPRHGRSGGRRGRLLDPRPARVPGRPRAPGRHDRHRLLGHRPHPADGGQGERLDRTDPRLARREYLPPEAPRVEADPAGVPGRRRGAARTRSRSSRRTATTRSSTGPGGTSGSASTASSTE